MWSTSLRAKENAGAGCCCCSSLSKVGPGCSLPHCEPDFQYPAHFRSSFPSEQMWEGGKSCSLNEQGSVTAEPGAGGFFPQGRWSGGQGDTLFQLFQPWEVGICAPSQLVACKPLSQEGKTLPSGRYPIPYTTVLPSPGANPQASSCPCSPACNYLKGNN